MQISSRRWIFLQGWLVSESIYFSIGFHGSIQENILGVVL